MKRMWWIERIWWIQYICDYFFITTHELSHLFSQFDPWQTVLAIYLANFESNKTQTQKVIRIKAVKTHEISSDRQKRTINYEICGLQKKKIEKLMRSIFNHMIILYIFYFEMHWFISIFHWLPMVYLKNIVDCF